MKKEGTASIKDLEQEVERLKAQLQTQVRLNESSNGLERVLDAVNAAVYHIDLRKKEGERITFVSGSFDSIFGIAKEDFLRDKNIFIPYYHPDDLKRIRETSSELERDKKPKTYYYRYNHPKRGAYIWIEEIVTPSVNEMGELVEIFGVARDVTERKEYEKELVASRESYRSLVEESPDGIIVAGFDQRIIFANKAVLPISGIATIEELIGHTLLEFLSPEQRIRSAERIKKIIGGEQVPFEIIKILHKDGTMVECESKPVLYTYIGQPTILVFLRNISSERMIEQETVRAQVAEESNRKLQMEVEERRRTEKELFATQKYLRLLIDSSLDMICASDPDGYVTEFNKAAQETFGYRADEVIGKHVSFLYREPNERMDVMKQLTEGSGYFSGEVTNLKKNGEEFTALLSASILKDENGKILGSMGVSRDITEWKRAEKELRLNEEKYRAIYNQAYIGIALVDTESDKFLQVNQRLSDILGYPVEELEKKSIHDLKLPGDLSRLPSGKDFIRHGFERVIDEHRYRHANGNAVVVNVTISLVRAEDHRPLYFVYVYEDLTPKRRAEEQLRLQAAKLNAIIESSSHMIWTIDRDYRLASFNGNQAKWLERAYGVTAYIGMPMASGKMLSVNDFNDFWVEKMNATFQDKPQNFEVSFTHTNGEVTWREIYLNPIKDAGDNVIEVSAIAHDITDKKQAEENLKLSLKEKEVLLKEVHHRVKNNLQVISSILNLQSSYVRDKKTLEILHESQNRIKSMAFVHESLYQTKDFANISFQEYVSNISRNLVASYSAVGAAPELELDLQNIDLNLDTAIPCGLIINELLSNALKYAFPEGKKGKVSVTIKKKQNIITIIIADNGIGLSEEIDFRNTDSLGLQLVTSLVEQINGKIKLDTKKGSKFTIEFSGITPNA